VPPTLAQTLVGAANSSAVQLLGTLGSHAEGLNTLEADALSAQKATDGTALLSVGFNMVQSGQGDAGLVLMEQGLAKGISRNADLARLRLVGAYALAGQRARAIALLRTDSTDGSRIDAIMGVSFFSEMAPADFGAFDRACLSLFRLTSGETWVRDPPSPSPCAAFMSVSSTSPLVNQTLQTWAIYCIP
jgi:hypothetical protein